MEFGVVRPAVPFPVADMVAAYRHLGRAQPLFPLGGGLWLVVGVEQAVPAQRGASVLRLEHAQVTAAQRGSALASPVGPVAGQGWVVQGRCPFDCLVTDDRDPGESVQAGAAVAAVFSGEGIVVAAWVISAATSGWENR